MEALGFARAVPAQTGRPAYDPRDLLKLYIYGYLIWLSEPHPLFAAAHDGMPEECGAFLSAEYAEARFQDDCRFPQGQPQGVEGSLQGFCEGVCGAEAAGEEVLRRGGTKIRASNSKKKSFTPQILDKKLDYLREQEQKIEEYLSHMDHPDEEEKQHVRILELDIRPQDMPEKLTHIRERIGKYEGYQKRMQETGENQIQETDPECRTIHTKEGAAARLQHPDGGGREASSHRVL